MAPRSLSSMKPAVTSETPICAASSIAETPLFERATSHMAWNQRLRCTFELCMHVPAVTENWWEHLVHCQMRFLSATGEQRALPHLGQAQPPGHLTSMIRLSQLLSSGYLVSIACRLPILPFSALTCLRFMVPISASLPRILRFEAIVRVGRDGNHLWL